MGSYDSLKVLGTEKFHQKAEINLSTVSSIWGQQSLVVVVPADIVDTLKFTPFTNVSATTVREVAARLILILEKFAKQNINGWCRQLMPSYSSSVEVEPTLQPTKDGKTPRQYVEKIIREDFLATEDYEFMNLVEQCISEQQESVVPAWALDQKTFKK